MISSNQLAEMSKLSIERLEPGTLADIGCITIKSSLSTAQRMERYLEQIKNPYCFLCGKVPVKVEFLGHAKPLEEKLQEYFSGLKNRQIGLLNPLMRAIMKA